MTTLNFHDDDNDDHDDHIDDQGELYLADYSQLDDDGHDTRETQKYEDIQGELYLADYSQLDQLPLQPNFVFYSPQVLTLFTLPC